MKKIAAIILTLFAASTIFASTQFVFSGTYALIGANGRTIRKTTTDIKESGVIFATGTEKAAAANEDYTLFLGKNSLASISQDENGTIVYLVYGSMSLVSDDSLKETIRVFTPTTLVETTGKGELCFISTETEEIIYNFSNKNRLPYDAIRGTRVPVKAEEGFDYIRRVIIDVDESYRLTEKQAEEIIRIPAAPIFVDSSQKLFSGVPSAPVFAGAIQTLTPDTPAFVEVFEALAPAAPAVSDTIQEVNDEERNLILQAETNANGFRVIRELVENN